jgi:hypothetical protein
MEDIWGGKRIKTFPLQSGELQTSFEEQLEPPPSSATTSEENNLDPKMLQTKVDDAIEHVEAVAAKIIGPPNPIKIYIPYSYNDINSLKEIETRISILKRQKWRLILTSKEIENDKE